MFTKYMNQCNGGNKMEESGVKMEIEPVKKTRVRKKKRNKTSFRPFALAREYAHRRHFKNMEQWKDFARTEKCPKNLPIHADIVYKGRGWKGWVDFLGSKMYTYEEAKTVAIKKNVLNGAVWKETAGRLFPRPSRMPLRPDVVYKDEWEGWTVFLGHEKVKSRHLGNAQYLVPIPKGTHYRPFDEAIKFVSKQGLKTNLEYAHWRTKYGYTDLPYRPDEVYEGRGWIGWGPWLGNKPLPGLMADTSVLYLARRPSDPLNVYTIHIEAMGKSEVMHRAMKEGFQVLRIWKYDPTLREEVRACIAANASSYGSDHEYIVQNVFGLYNDLFNLLVVI